MKIKYLSLLISLFFVGNNLQAQKNTTERTNAIKTNESVKELKQEKRTNKEARKAQQNRNISDVKKESTPNTSVRQQLKTREAQTQNQTEEVESPSQNEPQQMNTKPNNKPNTTQNNTNIPDISFLEQYIEEIIEERTNGNINWTQQYVEAVGQSVIDNERFKNQAQARAMATRGAVVVAQRNLLEMVQGVNVVGETTVEDMITTSDYIYTRVEGFVKGAKQVGPAREIDGMIEVRLRMPIYGNKGIAGALEPSDIEKAKSSNGYKTLVNNAQQGEPQNFEDLIDGSNPFVFNIMGQKIDPSMFPVVVDNEGNIQFDFSDLYETKTGRFPQFVQLSKNVMEEIGFQKGVDVINLVQNGKGEFTLSNDNKKGVFWQRLGNVARGIGRFLFSIIT